MRRESREILVVLFQYYCGLANYIFWYGSSFNSMHDNAAVSKINYYHLTHLEKTFSYWDSKKLMNYENEDCNIVMMREKR